MVNLSRPPWLVSNPMRRKTLPALAGWPSHQFPKQGLLRSGPLATISFTSQKLTRNTSLPEALPRPPYVVTTAIGWMVLVIQAAYRVGGALDALLRPRSAPNVKTSRRKSRSDTISWRRRCRQAALRTSSKTVAGRG